MRLPYENSTSGERALAEVQKLVRAFGCTKFGTMTDAVEQSIEVRFDYRDRTVVLKASVRGYAAAWMKEHPYNGARMKASKIEHEQKALAIASVAVCSILRDWIKGQITAIETGILTFEGAFLVQTLLSSGKTVLEEMETQGNLLPGKDGA